MDNQKVYNEIINKAKNRIITEYSETHHIIPKCLNGTNDKSNLVELTAREHFIAHWLLCRIYPENDKLTFAFWAMCNQKNKEQTQRYTPSARAYAEARELHSKFISNIHKGRTRLFTDEHKRKISEGKKGKSFSDEHRKKMSEVKKGHIVTNEAREKMRNTQLGRTLSDEHKRKISETKKSNSQKLKHITSDTNNNSAETTSNNKQDSI